MQQRTEDPERQVTTGERFPRRGWWIPHCERPSHEHRAKWFTEIDRAPGCPYHCGSDDVIVVLVHGMPTVLPRRGARVPAAPSTVWARASTEFGVRGIAS